MSLSVYDVLEMLDVQLADGVDQRRFRAVDDLDQSVYRYWLIESAQDRNGLAQDGNLLFIDRCVLVAQQPA